MAFFQVTIHSSGDIVFAYKDVPVAVDLIADNEHPVKVGLSDAYIVHKTIFCELFYSETLIQLCYLLQVSL